MVLMRFFRRDNSWFSAALPKDDCDERRLAGFLRAVSGFDLEKKPIGEGEAGQPR